MRCYKWPILHSECYEAYVSEEESMNDGNAEEQKEIVEHQKQMEESSTVNSFHMREHIAQHTNGEFECRLNICRTHVLHVVT